MADRPIFIPDTDGKRLVKEISISFVWNPGLAPVQKKKNVAALHAAAAQKGIKPILECSTKSDVLLGVRLSAFNLKVSTDSFGDIPLECAFQGSKVFQNGGPYVDLFHKDSREAKQDIRLKTSGNLTSFKFEGQEFSLVPKTAFYDWLFVKSLYQHREYLLRLHEYAGFSDIEFNPERSINCQARSCALFVSLQKKNLLDEVYNSAKRFIEILTPDSLAQPHSSDLAQGNLPGM